MATIRKRGESYQITVSEGYGIDGRNRRHYMTWTPEAGMTPRQVSSAVALAAAQFELDIRNGVIVDSSMKFSRFAEKYLTEYADVYLKPNTCANYRINLERINAAIGHMKLCDIKPTHISAFYRKLMSTVAYDRPLSSCTVDLTAWMKRQKISRAELVRRTGASDWVIRQLQSGNPVMLSDEDAASLARVLGKKQAQLFTVARRTKPLQTSSVLTYHRTLSAVMDRAVRWGYLDKNPCDKAERPSLDTQEAAYLEEEDARRLLELLQDEPIRWRALITFDLLSGLRRGELLGLRWSDVDIDAQTISVRQTINYLPSRGVYASTPKTRAGTRPIRLSRTAMVLLLEYKRWQDSQRTTLGDAWEGAGDSGLVFTTDFGKAINPDTVTAWFRRFIQHSGLPYVTIHSLRHTYASLMIAQGAPLVVVSHQLGHANASTTSNIYAHMIASSEARAALTMDRFQNLVISEDEVTAARSRQQQPQNNEAAGK